MERHFNLVFQKKGLSPASDVFILPPKIWAPLNEAISKGIWSKFYSSKVYFSHLNVLQMVKYPLSFRFHSSTASPAKSLSGLKARWVYDVKKLDTQTHLSNTRYYVGPTSQNQILFAVNQALQLMVEPVKKVKNNFFTIFQLLN